MSTMGDPIERADFAGKLAARVIEAIYLDDHEQALKLVGDSPNGLALLIMATAIGGLVQGTASLTTRSELDILTEVIVLIRNVAEGMKP